MSRAAEAWAEWRLALQFLTRLPAGAPPYTAARMARTPRWYPAVGALVGALAAAGFGLASAVWDAGFGAVAALAAGLMATGAFHEDGLADTCDGLGGGRTSERALEIMRDSRLGTYGVAALVLVLGGKAALLAGLDPWTGAAALVAMHAGGRLSAVVAMARSPYVRAEGTGAAVATGGGGWPVAVGATALAAAPAVILAPLGATLGALLAGLAHLETRRRVERRIGGHTGDTLGAVEQTGEIAILAGIAALA